MISDAEYREVVTEVIGSLIAGEARFFGRRVMLSWPDGPPPGWTEDGLQALGQTWIQESADRQGRWITVAEAEAQAVRRRTVSEALALSSYFTVHRAPDGMPAALVPLRDRVDFDPYSGGYIVRQESEEERPADRIAHTSGLAVLRTAATADDPSPLPGDAYWIES